MLLRKIVLQRVPTYQVNQCAAYAFRKASEDIPRVPNQKIDEELRKKDFDDLNKEAWYHDAETFAPSEEVNRQQLVTLLMRYASYKGIDTSQSEMQPLEGYSDSRFVSEWALKAMRLQRTLCPENLKTS